MAYPFSMAVVNVQSVQCRSMWGAQEVATQTVCAELWVGVQNCGKGKWELSRNSGVVYGVPI